MNKSSSRILQYFGIFLLSLFISYLVFTFAERDRVIDQAAEIEQVADVNIVGVWQSEPTFGQLGLIQSSYTFNADGSYSNKLDMMSFCVETFGHDCEYYWMVIDGGYSVKDGVLTLSIKDDKKVILRKGESKPDIHIDTGNPRSDEYMVKIDAGNLILTGRKNNESVIYKPFVDTEQDEEVPSVDAIDVEQTTDIVGVWQSERILGSLGYIRSGYTFTADGSYSNKVENLIFCKEVPELNCEKFWTIVDGKYAVKNGVITLYYKEGRAAILRKGESKPDIRIAPARSYSGDEYMAKLDAGKLFMTSLKNNELVVFKPINND